MPKMWGIHNRAHSLDLVGDGFVAVGWEELGDLSELSLDRDALKSLVAKTFPDAKPGAIPVWAGVLWRFMNEMMEGDYVVSPNKADRTINFGIVDGPYYYEPGAEQYPNRRKVKWVRTAVPRDDFPKSALNEIGSAVTLFQVNRHVKDFLPSFTTSVRLPNRSRQRRPRLNWPRSNPTRSVPGTMRRTSSSASSRRWSRTGSSSSSAPSSGRWDTERR
jgi:predicted Mrr-cat superfamily restriction endonuclease